MTNLYQTLSSVQRLQAGGSLLLTVVLNVLIWCTSTAAAATDDVSVMKRTRLSGVVVDENSRPLRSAMVGLLCNESVRDYSERNPEVVLSTLTDPSGRYELRIPNSIAEITVVAHAKGFAPARSALTALNPEPVTIAPLILRAGIQIAGHVVGEHREPISGAVVVSVPKAHAGDTAHSCSHPHTTTDTSGDFALGGLEPGMHSVSVAKKGFAARVLDGIRLEEFLSTQRINIELSRATFVSGRVIDSAGRPITGALLTGQPGPATLARSISDAAGGFRLGPFEHGSRVHLTTTAPNFSTVQTNDIISPMKGVIVQLSRNGSLRGLTVDEATRKPLTAFHISFHRRGPWRSAEFPGTRSFRSPEGRFEWADVASGRWDISVEAEGYQPLQVSGVLIPQGAKSENLVLALKKGYELRGRIVDAATGLGVRSAAISYVTNPGMAADALDRPAQYSTSTDANGDFVLKDLPPDPLVLFAVADGYPRQSREVSATAESFVEIALAAGGSISGRLLSSDGAVGIPGTITLWNLASDSGSIRRSDADGRFSFSELKEGRYQVSAESADGQASPRFITVTSNQNVTGLSLRLDSGGTIRGHVSGLMPGERGRVQIEVQAHSFRAETRMNDEGQFRLSGIPAGKMDVIATTVLDRSISKRIDLDGHEDVAVDFEFPRGYRLFGTVRRADTPVPFVDLKALPLEGQNVAVAGETSRSGQYVIDGIASGRYSVEIEGGRTIQIDIRGDLRRDFDLPENAVSGVVLDGQTGDPVSDALMEIRSVAGSGDEVRLETHTDHAGRYSLVGLDAGQYWLSAYKLGYDLVDQQIQLGASMSDMSIRLMPTDGVTLAVHDAVTRLPLRHIWVIEKAGQADGNRLTLMLDQLGVARLPPALRGRTFVISSFGYQVAEVANWNGAALELYLSPDDG